MLLAEIVVMEKTSLCQIQLTVIGFSADYYISVFTSTLDT